MGAINPSIKLNELTVTGSTTSTKVASNTNLTLALKSHSSVSTTSKIFINFPTSIYSRISILTSSPCSYSISGQTFTACSIQTDSNGWVTQMNLTDLGQATIPANSTITLTIQLTNSLLDIIQRHQQLLTFQKQIYVCNKLRY